MLNILDELGLDPAEFSWQDLGLCRGTVTSPDDDIFFDKYESDVEAAKAADQMCLHCPVIKQCFFEGAKGAGPGLRGGVYWGNSGKPDKNKNAHKTEEVWDIIREKVSQVDE